MSKKVVDLTEYKNNQEDIEAMVEDIPEEVLESYMKEIENDTPDLWTRIETGYEKELNLIDKENKARKRKTIGFIAAAALITVIAVPIAVLSQKGSKKDDSKKSDTIVASDERYKDDYCDAEATEAMEETADDYEMNDSDSVDDSFYNENYSEEDFEADSDNDYSTEEDSQATTSSDNNEISDTNSVSADHKEEENGTSGASYVDESLFAAEIEFDGIIYEISDKELMDKLPDNAGEGIDIDNTYCDYPEQGNPDETLTVYKMNDTDSYIYIKYFNKYKLYIKKTESNHRK